jgi:acetylornithine deacetylase/succinyl-diaminopimelate desuccinylase-like protein
MSDELGDDAVKHLARLIRIDTTNPPGNETPAAEYLAEILDGAKLAPVLVGATPDRKNVVARLRGDGSKAPLLLGAHLDVVPAEPESWRHPPFSGEIHDGYLWGRGAIDMKHMAVMSALVIARLAREGVKLTRDVIFAGVADEEAGCDFGSKFLVDHHPELVKAEFALGEAGAFTVHLDGQAIYPIQVAEKGTVWMKLRAVGKPGHGSLPKEHNAVTRLSEAIAALGRARLPHHRTAVVDNYLRAIAATQKFPRSLLLRNLHRRRIADLVLKKLPDRGVAAALSAVLSNTAVPTVLRAGGKVNVVPGFAEAEVDGRSLPGRPRPI